MKASKTRWVARGILAALFLLNVYRAATQSFTFDEAATYTLWVVAPWRAILEPSSSAANYLVYEVLMRISGDIFGASEFALRLPAVLAGGLYFVAVYRLCRSVFRDGLLFLLAVVAMAANPFVLDFLVAARSYGVSLAFFTVALWQINAWFESGKASRWRLFVSGAAGGLAIATTPAVFYPGLALTAALGAWYWHSADAPDLAPEKVVPRAVAFMAPAFAIVYLFLLFSPLLLMRKSDLHDQYQQSIPPIAAWTELTARSLAHNPGIGGLNSGNFLLEKLRWVIGFVLVPFSAVIALWLGWKRRSPAVFLVAATLIGAVLCTVTLYTALGIPLPRGRYSLLLLPLAGFLVAAAAEVTSREASNDIQAKFASRFAGQPAMRAISMAFLVGTMLLAIFYAVQVNGTHFADWKYEADTHDLLLVMKPRAMQLNRPVVLGGSWFFMSTPNYYRIRDRWTWLAPVGRQDADAPADFYLLLEEDRNVVSKLNLEVLAVGRVSGTTLAARRR